uniref:HMA domain-containing protein n=1 Tax=Panagrolaimus sp. ES5 TaxID=591445 RepID=A0AC34F9Q1_9BILA
MSDPSRVATVLKNALGVDVTHEGDGQFKAVCTHDELQTSLGIRAVLEALQNSGYSTVPCENGFSISHKNHDVGKLYGKDKFPKKEEEKKE